MLKLIITIRGNIFKLRIPLRGMKRDHTKGFRYYEAIRQLKKVLLTINLKLTKSIIKENFT